MSASLWMPAYIGIGSNLDDPPAQVQGAFAALATVTNSRLIARSPLYRTRPLGPQDQPDFVNAVAGLLTRLTAAELLQALKRIETDSGREQPVVRWGPRRIDLDLLWYADVRLARPDLVLPHPGLTERNFVLYPLRDIAPDLLIAGHGRISELAARAGSDGLAPLAALKRAP